MIEKGMVDTCIAAIVDSHYGIPFTISDFAVVFIVAVFIVIIVALIMHVLL